MTFKICVLIHQSDFEKLLKVLNEIDSLSIISCIKETSIYSQYYDLQIDCNIKFRSLKKLYKKEKMFIKEKILNKLQILTMQIFDERKSVLIATNRKDLFYLKYYD